MKKKNEKKQKPGEILRNNWYAVKLSFCISKSRVINAFFMKAFSYFEWVFFSAFFLRYIVDALDKGKEPGSIFIFIILCGILFFCINLYNNYTENVTFPLTATRLYFGIYKKLYTKAKNVELRCYEDSDFYNRYTMAIDDAGEKVTAIIDSMCGIVTGMFAVVMVFYSMFDIAPLSVLFILSPLVGNFLFGNIKNKLEFRRYQESAPNDKVMNYVNRVMYLPDYAKEIRLSHVFNLLKQQYEEATDRNVKIAGKYAFRVASANLLRLMFTFTVIFEGVLLFAVYENMVKGSISLAQLTVMTSLMVSATWILIGLFENIMDTIKNGLFISNLKNFLEYEEKIPEDQSGKQPSGEIISIEFDHVTFSYQKEETIKDLSFTVHGGEIVALVGHNGAGKSTIVKLLLRLYDPTEGVIRLNGTDIREYDLRAYRSLFATAFQDYRIFGMTVKDNVLMGTHPKNGEELVKEALKKAGVYDRIMALPEGIHTMMTKEFDDKGAVLSGGESQKVAVARAFVKKSPVRIFDEPSSALDPIAEYELFNSIMQDGKEHTMIFISHRLSSVKNSDRVFMLEKGRIIEEGTHRELMNKDGSYAQMYKKQAMNYLAVDSVEGVAL
ncbi:MAG: ABC transporter ATP-binding protein [Suilimivivens sp.]